jgi:hypothetical protein
MKLVRGFVNLTSIYGFLGALVVIALLTLHALTWCDTTDKFASIGEGAWVKRFLVEEENERFSNAMVSLQHGVSDEIILGLQSFMHKMYKFPRTDPRNIPNEQLDISATRYLLFRKSGPDGEKLPPNLGAFRMHVKPFLKSFLSLHIL